MATRTRTSSFKGKQQKSFPSGAKNSSRLVQNCTRIAQVSSHHCPRIFLFSTKLAELISFFEKFDQKCAVIHLRAIAQEFGNLDSKRI